MKTEKIHGMRKLKLGSRGHKVIENFLPKYQFGRIKRILESPNIPYYYHSYMVQPFEQQKRPKDMMFVHSLVRNKEVVSNYVDAILFPILDRLEVSLDEVLRSKINLTLRTHAPHESEFHVDQEHKSKPGAHLVALYYLHNCNGYTEFLNGDKIDSKENRMLLFDGSQHHRAITHTNEETKLRVTINTNFVGNPFTK